MRAFCSMRMAIVSRTWLIAPGDDILNPGVTTGETIPLSAVGVAGVADGGGLKPLPARSRTVRWRGRGGARPWLLAATPLIVTRRRLRASMGSACVYWWGEYGCGSGGGRCSGGSVTWDACWGSVGSVMCGGDTRRALAGGVGANCVWGGGIYRTGRAALPAGVGGGDGDCSTSDICSCFTGGGDEPLDSSSPSCSRSLIPTSPSGSSSTGAGRLRGRSSRGALRVLLSG